MVAYGTRREQEELEIIRLRAPDAKVVNPARYSGDPSKTHEHMEFYHGLVDECDIVVYSDVGGEFISAGVGEEVDYALEKGKPVYRIDHKTRKLVRVHGEAKHLSRTGTRLLYRTMKWSGFRGEDIGKMVQMKIAKFGGRLSEEDALLMVAADLGVNTKTLLNNTSKEAPRQIKAENKPSLFALEGFVSTFPKHQQDNYNAYRKALEMYQHRNAGGREITQSDIAKELNRPQTTVNDWIYEKHFPLIERAIRELKDLGLWPLTPDNPHLPLLARSAGHLTGDGHITRKLRHIEFFDGEEAGLENLKTFIKADFPKLSVPDVKKYTMNEEYCLIISNSALAHLFAALGVPVGDKVEVPFSVPEFVLNGSKEVKSHYIAGIIGSEMTTPELVTPHSANPIRFSLSKIESLEKEHKHFMEQIRGLMLNEFGITTSEVRRENRPPPANPRYYFSIDSRVENMIKFFESIPIELFANKGRGKEEVMEAFKYHFERKEWYDKTMALSAQGMTPAEIYRELKQKVPRKTIVDWIKGYRKPILG